MEFALGCNIESKLAASRTERWYRGRNSYGFRGCFGVNGGELPGGNCVLASPVIYPHRENQSGANG